MTGAGGGGDLTSARVLCSWHGEGCVGNLGNEPERGLGHKIGMKKYCTTGFHTRLEDLSSFVCPVSSHKNPKKELACIHTCTCTVMYSIHGSGFGSQANRSL